MTSPYDAMVAQLTALGIPRPKAEARARAECGLPAIETPGEAAMREQLEAKHTEEGDKLMRALGFEVVRLEQRRASKIQPGLPDRRYYHRRHGVALWWEAKAEWGRQRPDQREFQAMVEACGETYVLGKLEVLKTWLVDAGIAGRDGELLVPIATVPAPTPPGSARCATDPAPAERSATSQPCPTTGGTA